MAKAKIARTIIKQETLIEEKFDKYFWLVIPFLTLIYFWISNVSVGFYQDDEIAQYLNAIKFQVDPFSILGNNPKPGWKIFLILPALIDYQAVLIFNALVASLAVFFTFKLLKEYKLNYAFFGALLLAVQPLYFDLSFRAYSEIFTALLVVIFLILYKREKYILSGLLIGYVLTIRQELIVFAFVLFIVFAYNKRIIPAISIVVFPLIYSILGMIKTGDPLFVITEMKAVAGLQYNSQGVFHYFKVYIFIVGPITLLLFLQGFFGFLADTKNYKTYIEKYFLLYVLFITVFGVQIYTMLSNGPNPGNWRYLLHISPVAILFATVGFNNLVEDKFKKLHYAVTGLIFFVTLLFLSKESDGFKLLETDDYTKVAFIAIFFIATLIISSKDKIAYLNKLSVVLIIASVLYLYLDFKPKKLSPENQTVKTVAESLNNGELKGNFYTNHSVLLFFMDDYKKAPQKFLPINSKYINDVPKGSILVWENHYGYRPEFGNDIKIEDLQKNSDYKVINQYVSLDKRFVAYIIEKVN
ncbi:MAG: hypothetical protein WC139_03315 [Candidatus Kapaibacterium sp.]